MPSGPRKIGGELRCILSLFLQQLYPAQSWESDFFSGADSATDHEVNMTGEYSGFVNVLDGENATSHAAICQQLVEAQSTRDSKVARGERDIRPRVSRA